MSVYGATDASLFAYLMFAPIQTTQCNVNHFAINLLPFVISEYILSLFATVCK